MSDTNPWMLPKLSDYLNPETDAVQRFADKVKISPHPERDLKEIREAVSEHTKILPLKWLWTMSYLIADDLYKTGNRLPLWAEEHRQYVNATAATFFEMFHEKGYVLRYGVNNGFEQTDVGMQRPLYLLPALFRAAGLVYICPEEVGLSLMESDGIPGSNFLKEYGRYKDESRDMAKKLISKCNEVRKSYVVLDLGDDPDLFHETRADTETKMVTIFRSEPPVVNSNVSVSLPKLESSNSWPVEKLGQETTSAIFRDAATGRWTAERAELHEKIINRLLAGKRPETIPKICVVTGGVGSGKSTLIKSELAPEHPGAVVIDADQMWVEIPEYEALAAADWRTAGDRTYAEVRYLRDAVLAEAATRRLDIILEISGNSGEIVDILVRDGYQVSWTYVHCLSEQAQERMLKRANSEPTPEDNLWCSLPRPEFPDKYDYQDVAPEIFRQEYAKRKGQAQGSDAGLR